ncbi:EamA family transporter, partial [Nocardia sp. NPDC058497]|uniref:EamA family transporter n=1 Tax=Nocardia sp. NPDC058497 TaxID=3346529 RepID=UPI00364BC837
RESPAPPWGGPARGGGCYGRRVPAGVEGAPPAIDGSAALGYLWMGVCGGLLAYVVWFRGLGSLPVTSVAVLLLLSPLVAAVLGAVLLGQWLGPIQLAGFGLALAAIVAGQLPEKAPSARPSTSKTSSAAEISPSATEPA